MSTLIAPTNHSSVEDGQALQHAFKGCIKLLFHLNEWFI